MKDFLHATLQLDGYSLHDPQYDVDDLSDYLLLGYTSAGTITTEPVPAHRLVGYSVTVSCPSTGSPAGTAKLQGCNDVERISLKSDDRLDNWFDVASGGDRIVTAAISNATVKELCDPHCRYRWFRVVYTPSGGEITITVKVQGKSED